MDIYLNKKIGGNIFSYDIFIIELGAVARQLTGLGLGPRAWLGSFFCVLEQ